MISIRPHQILNVKIFLISSGDRNILVDTGIPGQEGHIKRAIESWGVKAGEISHIILTHGHLDHIGCLGYVRQLCGAKVICHQTLAETLAAGRYEEAVPRVGTWKILNAPLSRLLSAGLCRHEPEIVFNQRYQLSALGIPGRIVHTPGHSPASCSIVLDCGVCLTGDLVRQNWKGLIDTGLFYDSQREILHSLERISTYKPRVLYPSHGKPLSAADLERFLAGHPF